LAAAINYIVDIHWYLGLPGSLRVLLAAFQLYLPILGSSLVFGRLFQRSDKSSHDMGMNILGAIFGGMLEYTSLIFGTRMAYIFAFVISQFIGGLHHR
jgi:hypothetical protein